MPLQALVSLCFMLISSMGTVLHRTFRLRSVVDCGWSMLELIPNLHSTNMVWEATTWSWQPARFEEWQFFDGCWSLTLRGWTLWEPAGGIFTVFLGLHRSVGMQVRLVQCFWVKGMTPSHFRSHYLGQTPLSSVSSLPNTSSCGGLWVSLIRSKYYKDTPPKRFGIWKTRITPSTVTVGLQGMTSI